MNRMEKILTWVATLILPVFVFLVTPIWESLFEEKKAIEYSIISERKIFDKDEFKDQWSVFRLNNGTSDLDKAYLTMIRVSNSGKAPIKSDDFESAIKFEIRADKGNILPRLEGSEPKDLPVEIRNEAGLVTIAPLLLNPGDNFAIEVLSESRIEITKVTGRIVGINGIHERPFKSYEGVGLFLVKPGERIATSIHSPLMKIRTHALVAVSLATSFIACLFFFAGQASGSRAYNYLLLTAGAIIYVISITTSKFIPISYFGALSQTWMEYASQAFTLIFGMVLAVGCKAKLKVIRLEQQPPANPPNHEA